MISSSHRFCGRPGGRAALRWLVDGSHCAAKRDHLLLSCVATLAAHCHCRFQYTWSQSSMLNFSIVCSARRVARFMKSTYGSVSSSVVVFMSCCRSVLEVVLSTSLSSSLLLSLWLWS